MVYKRYKFQGIVKVYVEGYPVIENHSKGFHRYLILNKEIIWGDQVTYLQSLTGKVIEIGFLANNTYNSIIKIHDDKTSEIMNNLFQTITYVDTLDNTPRKVYY